MNDDPPNEAGLGALSGMAVSFTCEELRASPPDREAVLETESGALVLPKGIVFGLGAEGGSGKTMLFFQLAAECARGGVLFGRGGYRAKKMRTVVVVAEEDRAEAQRRLHAVTVGWPDADLAMVAERVVVLPLRGQDVELVVSKDKSMVLEETSFAAELRDFTRSFDLALVDPLTRMTPEENSNRTMRRIVQVFESCGVTVGVSAHTRKAGKDEDFDSVDCFRGGKALTDSFRQAFALQQLKRIRGVPDLIRFLVVKTNYTARIEPLTLCRPHDGSGTLRVATTEEIETYEAAKGASQSDRLGPAVMAELAKAPESATALAKRLKKGKGRVTNLLNEFCTEGTVQFHQNKWHLTGPVVRPISDLNGRSGPPIHRGPDWRPDQVRGDGE